MKKLLVTMLIGAFLGASAHAAIVRTVNKSVPTSVKTTLMWNKALTEIEYFTMTVQGTQFDSDGKNAGGQSITYTYDDLSPQVKATMKTSLEFLGKQYANDTVNEDVAPSFKSQMARPRGR